MSVLFKIDKNRATEDQMRTILWEFFLLRGVQQKNCQDKTTLWLFCLEVFFVANYIQVTTQLCKAIFLKCYIFLIQGHSNANKRGPILTHLKI